MCQPLCKLLGKELSSLASGEKVQTSELIKDGRSRNIIGLLFAADDAASTKRAATQLEDLRDSLVELHGALKRGSCEVSFEIVLILMSRTSCPEDSQAGIKQLFSQKDSPFHLISSEKADKIQAYLSRKYEVQETPCLVLLDGPTTDVVLYNAVEHVLRDRSGVNFPWQYPPFPELLQGSNLLCNFGVKRDKDDCDPETHKFLPETISPTEIKTPVKALLFAAFWCPPCRTFMTALTELYERVNDREKKLEIIFVSSDRSQESFNRFYVTMPWLAVPYENEKCRDTLTKAFNVKAIPNLTLLDDKDKIITTEGRLEINDDLEGIDFPWYPRVVEELRDRHSVTLNNSTCVLYFTDESETDYEMGDRILSSVAVEIEKSSVEEACQPRFFIAADSDLAESLRIFMDLDETRSFLIIMDAASFRYAVHEGQSDETKVVSKDSVKQFLLKFETNKLVYKYMQSRFV